MEVRGWPDTLAFSLLSPGFESPSKGRQPLQAFPGAGGRGSPMSRSVLTHTVSLTPPQPTRWASSLFHFTDEEAKAQRDGADSRCTVSWGSLLPEAGVLDGGIGGGGAHGPHPCPGTLRLGSRNHLPCWIRARNVDFRGPGPGQAPGIAVHCPLPPLDTVPTTVCPSVFSGSPSPSGPAVTSPMSTLFGAQDKSAPTFGHQDTPSS